MKIIIFEEKDECSGNSFNFVFNISSPHFLTMGPNPSTAAQNNTQLDYYKISSLPVKYGLVQNSKFQIEDFGVIPNPNQNQELSIHKENKIHKMPYSGTWSSVRTTGFKPVPRIGNCYVYDPLYNIIFIAYGISEDKTMLGDSWIINLNTFEWECVCYNVLSPRTGVSAILYDRKVYMFGGQDENNNYFADFHVLDLDTKKVTMINDEYGNGPSPRANPTLFFSGDSIFVWGGYDGHSKRDYYEFSLFDQSWAKLEDPEIEGRRISLYSLNDDKSLQYAFGSNATDQIIKFDPQTRRIEKLFCKGHIPRGSLKYAAMAVESNFLFVFGGKHTTKYTFLYALDLDNNNWFKFHIVPDGLSVLVCDGNVNENGLFEVPRVCGQSMIFSTKDKCLYSIFGDNYLSSCPVQKIELGSALAILNMRTDMKHMLSI